MNELLQTIDRFPGSKVLVLGDLMLDRYTWGHAERVSPEAPVLVLRADQHEVRPGGAASVAYLLRHLEAQVTLVGVIGDDADGRVLQRVMDESGIQCEHLIKDPNRCTTVKERFLGRIGYRHPHQILRVDHEITGPIHSDQACLLRDAIVRDMDSYDAILIADYAKGVCTPELLQDVIREARSANVPVLVDPARIANYSQYRGATLIKPNRVEAELFADERIYSPTDAVRVAERMQEEIGIASIVLTLDRDGLVVVGDVEGVALRLVEPARPREVCDITGAGDMVLAVAGACVAQGWSLRRLAQLANAAAALQIQRLGIAPVTWSEILQGINKSRIPPKLATLEQLQPLLTHYRSTAKRIVFTNGCFDLLHLGHVSYLQEASSMGDVLIVAINSDAGVRRLKGTSRPIIGEADRAAMLSALSCVDHVIVFDEDTPHHLLETIRPDSLVKGGTYRVDQVVGREVVEAYGGQVCVVGHVPGTSTSELVSRIRGAKCV